MRTGNLALALLMVLALPCAAFAAGFCCQMPTGVLESVGGVAATGKGDLYLRADYSYSRMERFFEGDSQRSFSSVQDDRRFTPMMGMAVIPEYMDMHRITLTGSYSLSGRTRLVLAVPWVINNMSMQMYMMGRWNRMVMDEVSELGDVTLTGYYRLYQDREIMPTTALSAGVGLKFPTGSSTVSERGARIHAHMQPGTGSWDPLLSVSFVKMVTSELLVQADASYQITTPNRLEYEYGDTASVNAKVYYNLVDFLNLYLGVGYLHVEQADDPDNNYKGQVRTRLIDFVGNSGEDSIWITPGVQVLPADNLAVDVKFSYPLYYNVGGLQQVTDYTITAGVSYGF